MKTQSSMKVEMVKPFGWETPEVKEFDSVKSLEWHAAMTRSKTCLAMAVAFSNIHRDEKKRTLWKHSRGSDWNIKELSRVTPVCTLTTSTMVRTLKDVIEFYNGLPPTKLTPEKVSRNLVRQTCLEAIEHYDHHQKLRHAFVAVVAREEVELVDF